MSEILFSLLNECDALVGHRGALLCCLGLVHQQLIGDPGDPLPSPWIYTTRWDTTLMGAATIIETGKP